MIFQICISLITRWDNSSESYRETVLHGKIMEIEPNLFLTPPGGLWLRVLERTSYSTKSKMVQCGQTDIKSSIFFPYGGINIFLPESPGLASFLPFFFPSPFPSLLFEKCLLLHALDKELCRSALGREYDGRQEEELDNLRFSHLESRTQFRVETHLEVA